MALSTPGEKPISKATLKYIAIQPYLDEMRVKVREILFLHEDARDNDMRLLIHWLIQENIAKYDERSHLLSMDFELARKVDLLTIVRRRQEIQAAGDCLPASMKIIEKRDKKDQYQKGLEGFV